MKDLEPGKELDALIAEKVFGVKNAVIKCPKCGSSDLKTHFLTGQDCCASCEFNLNYKGRFYIPKRYSTDISAAWAIVEKFSVPFESAISLGQIHIAKDKTIEWVCKIEFLKPKYFEFAHAKTAPHAIALASLRAVERKEG